MRRVAELQSVGHGTRRECQSSPCVRSKISSFRPSDHQFEFRGSSAGNFCKKSRCGEDKKAAQVEAGLANVCHFPFASYDLVGGLGKVIRYAGS